MKDTEENKNNKKHTVPKKKSTGLDTIESKNIRHQRHSYKYKKNDMQQDELWQEWREYYK